MEHILPVEGAGLLGDYAPLTCGHSTIGHHGRV
jgi:hypothetical protein